MGVGLPPPGLGHEKFITLVNFQKQIAYERTRERGDERVRGSGDQTAW